MQYNREIVFRYLAGAEGI